MATIAEMKNELIAQIMVIDDKDFLQDLCNFLESYKQQKKLKNPRNIKN